MIKNILFVITALLFVIANAYNGHHNSPSGITCTPYVIIATSLIAAFALSSKLVYKVLFSLFFMLLNDVLIRLYSGGRHDYEGAGWIMLSLLLGASPSFLILIIAIYRDKKETRRSKIIALLLFPLIVIAYTCFFDCLGIEVIAPKKVNFTIDR